MTSATLRRRPRPSGGETPWTFSSHRCGAALSAYLVLLGESPDAIVFTEGIGENSARGCGEDDDALDLDCSSASRLDATAEPNGEGRGRDPRALGSRVQIWIMPTNEELVVAFRRAEGALLEGR